MLTQVSLSIAIWITPVIVARTKDVIVYCSNGGRSATASQTLVDNGFSSVYNMLGGITAWKSAGYWAEIVHDGDLTVLGMQTYTIEDCTCTQKGNVIASGTAGMIIQRALVDLYDLVYIGKRYGDP